LIPSILQVVGLATISLGLGLFILPLGIVAAGVSILLIGLAFEKGK
jgi:hypothetical protein